MWPFKRKKNENTIIIDWNRVHQTDVIVTADDQKVFRGSIISIYSSIDNNGNQRLSLEIVEVENLLK